MILLNHNYTNDCGDLPTDWSRITSNFAIVNPREVIIIAKQTENGHRAFFFQFFEKENKKKFL